MNLFTDYGFRPSILKTLKEKNLYKPTEIQKLVMPLLASRQSVVAVSETGSGKTLAYVLPVIQFLKSLEDDGQPVEQESSPRAVVMVPTRELGDQVMRVFKSLTHDTRLRVRPALGGMALVKSRENTSGKFEILLATPGRLVQMLDRNLINLSDVRILIFDEADQMLDQGFLSDSSQIADACSEDVQMALFSATISPQVEKLMSDLFQNVEVVRSSGSGKTVASLITKNLTVIDGQRWPLFEKLLKQKGHGGTIVFTNTREQCEKLSKQLTDFGYPHAQFRGEMDKNDRRQGLKKFIKGEIDLLVSTDLGGRGLDVENITRVINYHLPKEMQNYIHRVGRTARGGKSGVVYNLVTERDARLIGQLEGNKTKSSLKKPKPQQTKVDQKKSVSQSTKPTEKIKKRK